MLYQIDLTEDEVTAVRDLCDWLEKTAPAGLPMTPQVREGRLLLGRIEAFRAKWPGMTRSTATPVTAVRGADPDLAASVAKEPS